MMSIILLLNTKPFDKAIAKIKYAQLLETHKNEASIQANMTFDLQFTHIQLLELNISSSIARFAGKLKLFAVGAAGTTSASGTSCTAVQKM